MTEIPSSESVSTRLQYIAKLAREMPGTALTSLSHHIDVEWLREAWRRTRKDAAAGVDGPTAEEYAADLEGGTSGGCSTARSPAPTRPRPCGGCTSRRGRETRPGPSGSRRSRT